MKVQINRKDILFIIFSMTVFCFLCIHGLSNSALWGDEWVEYKVSQLEVRNGVMYDAIISNFQPPLYNFLMHFWLKISLNVLWFRSFNVVLCIITGICIFLTNTKLHGINIGCMSLILMAGCYEWVYCVQECSEYCLMLMFLAMAIMLFVYIDNDERLYKVILFVLASIGAMYSQYGAIFVVGPLLVVYFWKVICSKEIKKIVVTTIVYVIALITAAFPLYNYFAKIQIANNEISEHADAVVNIDIFKNLLVEFGNILCFFWHIESNDSFRIVRNILGITFLGLVVLFVTSYRKKGNNIKSNLLMVFLLGYVAHYFLTVFQIYAMVHPNQSSGFMSRYSYFYIPLLMVVIPIIVSEVIKQLGEKKETNVQVLKGFVIGTLVTLMLVSSIPQILINWNKAYDDQFADIWIEQKAYDDTTYLLGCAEFGFEHYVINCYGEQYDKNVYSYQEIDYDNLPDVFWLWRTNFGGGDFYSIINMAQEKGYFIEIISDNGFEGQLARCIRID